MTRLGAAAVVLMLAACGDSNPVATPATASVSRVSTLDGPARLRDEFVRAAGTQRLVLFLSPT